MSRKFIPCLGVALGAALMAGTPAFAYSSVTEAVLQQSQTSQGAAGSPTTEPATSATRQVAGAREAAADAAEDLGDRIERAWKSNSLVTDADIEARVDGTRVILEGEVRTEAMRRTAERVAKDVRGVSDVDNRIVVRTASARTATDRDGTKGSVLAGDAKDTAETAGSAIARAAEATKDAVVTGAKKTADVVAGTPEKIDETWITAKIAGKINADDALEHVDVDVKVDENVVSISGDVPSTALRDRVLRIARETEGVVRVVDKMTVKPSGDR